MNENQDQRYLLLRLHNVNHIDISGVRMLESIVRAYRERGGDVFLVKAKKTVHDLMESAGFVAFIGESHFLPEDDAIGHLFYHVLDPVVCIYECPVRAFKECQNLPKLTLPITLTNVPHTLQLRGGRRHAQGFVGRTPRRGRANAGHRRPRAP